MTHSILAAYQYRVRPIATVYSVITKYQDIFLKIVSIKIFVNDINRRLGPFAVQVQKAVADRLKCVDGPDMTRGP